MWNPAMNVSLVCIIEGLRKQDREVSKMIVDNYGAMWAKDKLRTARQAQEAIMEVLTVQYGYAGPFNPEQFLEAIRENRGTNGQLKKTRRTK
jgi:hypothetical protein